jgi:hypothetical protein
MHCTFQEKADAGRTLSRALELGGPAGTVPGFRGHQLWEGGTSVLGLLDKVCFSPQVPKLAFLGLIKPRAS